MNKIFFIILISLIPFASKGQTEYLPVKYAKSWDEINQDSIFSYFLSKIEKNFSNVEFKGISEMTHFTDSLDKAKISFKTSMYDFSYTEITDYNLTISYLKKIHNNKKNHHRTLLMCNRTLTPNSEKKYFVFFYFIE